MDELGDLLGDAFGFVVGITKAPNLTAAGETRSGICTALDSQRLMMETGYHAKFSCTFELKREDFEALKILNKKDQVTLSDYRNRRPINLQVMEVRDDSSDPCVILVLQQDPRKVAT